MIQKLVQGAGGHDPFDMKKILLDCGAILEIKQDSR